MKSFLNKYIPIKLALFSLMILFGGSVLFHFIVITGILPYNFVWGGKLKTNQEMFAFEGISIISNLLMFLIVISKLKFLNLKISQRNYKIVFWAISILFFMNTFGNLVSENIWETVIFTPLTLISAIFAIRIALDK